MIMRKSNKKDGEPLTLNELFKELNELFKDDVFVARNDDPKFSDIKSMLKSLVDGEACFEEKDEDDAMTACSDSIDPEGIEIPENNGGMIGYNSITEASKADGNIMTQDIYGVDMPIIAFIAPNHMMEGVVETIRSMARPTIVAKEYVGGVVNVLKASIACGKKRENLIEKCGSINALVFDEKSGMCRFYINRKDGYDFIFGENGVTRFIIFDELSCPATIPTDIVQDDRKCGKRIITEVPKMLEKRIEENKKTPLCNLPKTCTFDDCPHDVKNPIIADIMKDFAEAKGSGKVGKDTFVEFMKPENKEAVASAVATSIAEHQNPSDVDIEKDEVTKAVESAIFEDDSDDFTDEDTNPDCFRCIAEYMAKEGVDSINFWTDAEGLIHCDVQIKTVYKVELEDSDKK